MADHEDYVALPSDSDDMPLNDFQYYRTPLSQQQQPSALSEDPDWVRSFTPASKAPLKDSDSDSIINLLSDLDDNPETSQTPKEPKSENTKTTTAPKKGRPVAGPSRKSLPLVAAARLDDGLTLLQEDSDLLDLSGDVGAVGRVKVDGDNVMMDIKGTLYSAVPYVCNSLCVVAVGDEDAKISAVMNHTVILRAQKNVFAADYNGALDGHTFEDDDPVAVEGAADEEEAREPKKKRGRPPIDQSKKTISKPNPKGASKSKAKSKKTTR